MLDDRHMRCDECGCYGIPRAFAGRCYCGAKSWENTAPPPPPPAPPVRPYLHLVPPPVEPSLAGAHGSRPTWGAPTSQPVVPPPAPIRMVSGDDTTSIPVIDYVGARLNELLGGVNLGATILVVGKGGAGKSTATADLMVHAARHWSTSIYWLDADQRDRGLIRRVFENGKHSAFFVQRGNVKMLPDRDVGYSWSEALGAEGVRDAGLLVVDSLEAWVSSSKPDKQVELLRGLKQHPAFLKIVIGGANKDGKVSGVEDLARAVDATVYATRVAGVHQLHFDKRRWDPCPSAEARGAGVLAPPAPEPPPAPSASSERVQGPVAAEEPALPDYSRDFIAEAAIYWDKREMGEYLAVLRRKQVHRATIQDWIEAVEEKRLLEAGEAKGAPVPEVEPDEPEQPDEPDEPEDDDGSGASGAPTFH